MAKRGSVFRKGEGGTFFAFENGEYIFRFGKKMGVHLVFVFLTIFLLMERFELQKSRVQDREFTRVLYTSF